MQRAFNGALKSGLPLRGLQCFSYLGSLAEVEGALTSVTRRQRYQCGGRRVAHAPVDPLLNQSNAPPAPGRVVRIPVPNRHWKSGIVVADHDLTGVVVGVTVFELPSICGDTIPD